MKLKIIKNQNGTSLIEMMVAVGIFVIIGTLSLHIFKATLESQKNAIAAQNTQENLRYLFEIMSKEIRQAQVLSDDCKNQLGSISTSNEIYYKNNNNLYFKNKDNLCVRYYLDSSAIKIKRISEDGATYDIDLPLTPNEIKVTDFAFDVIDNLTTDPPGTKIQPYVTFKIELEASNASQQKIIMQTTVSSRHYE